MHRRLALLVTLITVALGAAACGRATEDQINQALGITPTATQSAEQIASATEAASATAAARLLAASSPGRGRTGRRQSGKPAVPDLVQRLPWPGRRGTRYSLAGEPRRLRHGRVALALVREGVGHPNHPIHPVSIARPRSATSRSPISPRT